MQSLFFSSVDDRENTAGWQSHKSRLLLASFTLIILITGSFLVPAVAQARAVPIVLSTPATDPLQISRLTMIDQKHGWALDKNQHVYITAQGPEHWTDVTPAFLIQNTSSYITTTFFLDATHGYIGLLLGNDTYLLRTQNGGHSWETTSFTLSDTGDPLPIYQITFINAQHGWLAIERGQVNPGAFQVLLLRTSDGGKTWQTMVDTSQNPADLPTPYSLSAQFSFVNPLEGWVTGIVPAGYVYLYTTHDGGKTWSEANIAPLKGGNEENIYTQDYGPIWQNSHTGTLFVLFDRNNDNGTQHLATYQTYDAGKSWILGPSSSVSANPALSFPTAQRGLSFGFDAQGQYAITHTNNSGLSWQTFHPTGLLPAQADQQVLITLDFITTTTGWLIIQDGQGNNDLFQTTTGGHNWHQLLPVIN